MASMEPSGPAVPVLRGRSLTKTYGSGEAAVYALREVDIDIVRGEFIVLLGASGSGKSTLLNILGGLDVPTSGQVEFRGQTLTGASDEVLTRYRREHVGFVFQFYNLIPSLTVAENVALVTDIVPDPMPVDEAVNLVGLSPRKDHFPSQLSGGEQQRVAIARAIAKRPALLLCDEPLLSLDLHHQQGVSSLINEQCHGKNSAVVFVTHEINPVIDYVDRVLYLAGGRFRVGTPEEVMTTEVLSDLYNSHVEVIRANGRIVVVGLPDATTHFHDDAHATAGEEL